MNEVELIKALSNAFGPSGLEDDVIALLKAELKDQVSLEENHVRDLFVDTDKSSTHRTILLDAHSDEVGIMVQAIKPNGMLEFLTLGSWQNNTLPGTKLVIKNSDGELVSGIVSSIPPHYIANHGSGGEMQLSDMSIDIGATSKDDVINNYHIGIGNFGVPETSCSYDEAHGIFQGKAFDCRIGVAAMTQVIKEVVSANCPPNVHIVGAYTSQEEVGERGAYTASSHFKPDAVICFEGCPADDTFTPEYKIQTGLKRGPMLRHMDRSIIANPRFMKFAIETAKEHNIPLQEAVRSGGGINGAIYQQQGAPSICIGIPVRYIHSPNCYTALEDYKAAIELAKAIIYKLNDDIVDSFQEDSVCSLQICTVIPSWP